MSTIFIFFIIILVLVLVHELGHFLVAKWTGMRVDEFAFGFPPRLFSKKIGETEYSFNLLPLGGYVKIFGENGEEETGEDLTRAFNRQSKWKQIAVLVAGVTMNILLAWLLLAATFTIGVETAENSFAPKEFLTNTKTVVSEVVTGSPAASAGILPLDVLKSISSQGVTVESPSPEDFSSFIASHQSDSVQIVYERNGTLIAAEVYPAAGFAADKKIVGISSTLLGTLKMPFHKALVSSAIATYEFTKLTFIGFYDLFAKLLSGEGKEAAQALTGPVGIVGLVGEAESSGIGALLAFTALISINLAVLNILPLPALDGGRIVFVAIESIMRRPISFRTQNLVNGISFALLLVLMVVVTYRDIIKLF